MLAFKKQLEAGGQFKLAGVICNTVASLERQLRSWRQFKLAAVICNTVASLQEAVEKLVVKSSLLL